MIIGLAMNYLKLIETLSCESNKTIAPLGGSAGMLLFRQIVATGYVVDLEEELDNYFELVSNQEVDLTFCNGLAGLSWLFSYFNEQGVIEVDMNEVFGETDEYLYKWMMQQITIGNYDYLHGAIGIGVYFLLRTSNKKHRKYLSDLVDGLDKIAIQKDDGAIKFISVINHETGAKGYNLSLSHGISSIIVYLARAVEQGVNTEKAKVLLIGSVQYLLNSKLPENGEYNSVFTGAISNEIPLTSSRLAWCYGDLGNGIALYQAGIITKNKEWEEFAMSILTKCTKRRDLKQNSVLDAGLCHGTAGIGLVFHRMYLYTNNEVFKEAAQFWFDETKKMAIHKDGIAGYKAWHGKEGWVNETNLLEGVSGIGLALYCWENNIDPDWDRCLLLS